MTKGVRMKLLVAPTIFMIAISSLRPKVVSLMVFDMMKTATIKSITMRMIETAATTFRKVTMPFEISIGALTSSMPVTCPICVCVSCMRLMSSR